MTTAAFEEGIAILSATYPNLQLTPKTLQVWRKLLEDLPDEAFLRAIVHLCRQERQIYPGTNVVAVIRQAALGAPTGIVALSLLEEAMRRHGAYRSVIFADPLIHLVVDRMGGWPKLCGMDEDEWKFLRRDFERLYDAAAREPVPAEQLPAHLPGIAEISNAAKGYVDEPVALVDLRPASGLPESGRQAALGGGER